MKAILLLVLLIIIIISSGVTSANKGMPKQGVQEIL